MWASLSSPAFLVHVWPAVQVQKSCLKVNIDHCYVEVVLIMVISYPKMWYSSVCIFFFFFQVLERMSWVMTFAEVCVTISMWFDKSNQSTAAHNDTALRFTTSLIWGCRSNMFTFRRLQGFNEMNEKLFIQQKECKYCRYCNSYPDYLMNSKRVLTFETLLLARKSQFGLFAIWTWYNNISGSCVISV